MTEKNPNRVDNLIDAMSNVSGLPRSETNEIWEKVKKNRQRLDSCSQHHFTLDLTPDKSIAKRWRCTRCSGEIDGVNKSWYELGLEHAAKTE